MKPLHILLIATFGFVTILIVQNFKPVSHTTYSPAGAYELTYPDDWLIEDRGGGRIVLSPPEHSKDLNYPILLIEFGASFDGIDEQIRRKIEENDLYSHTSSTTEVQRIDHPSIEAFSYIEMINIDTPRNESKFYVLQAMDGRRLFAEVTPFEPSFDTRARTIIDTLRLKHVELPEEYEDLMKNSLEALQKSN